MSRQDVFGLLMVVFFSAGIVLIGWRVSFGLLCLALAYEMASELAK
jgi:hypothetical protein